MEKIIEKISSPLREWLDAHNFKFIGQHIELILLLIFCSGILPLVWKLFKALLIWIETENAAAHLPYFERSEIKDATQFYISTNGQNLSPSNELEPYSQIFTAKNKLVPFFIKSFRKNQQQKYYIILADSGMGKSTFLINLYLKYRRRFWMKRYKIKLLPLGHPEAEDEVLTLDNKQKEQTILFLDAFDEDPKASENLNQRLNEILKKAWRYKRILITCRTQFFPSEIDEPMESGVYKPSLDGPTNHPIKKIYISPFDEKDVRKYINLKFPILKFWLLNKRKRAKKIIELCPNLMVRPMLLSYIDMLLESSIDDKAKKEEGEKLFTSSDVYELLIRRWILREANRISYERRDKFIIDMYLFSKNLAIDMFINRNRRKGLFFDPKEIVAFATTYSIDLSEVELKGKSLLNRDATGRLKFAHKSILEFIVAKHAAENLAFAEGVLEFNGLKEFDQARRFYNELSVLPILPKTQ